jgi:hypothetical protein
MKQTLTHSMRDGRAGRAGPEHVMRQELLNAVSQAIKTLKLQYRNILTLRCFQQLSYAEIAQVMGGSEIRARMLFFRAKQSLTKQLKRDGFNRLQLLPGLTLFAAATLAPTEKATATTVSAATIHTGLGIKLLTLTGTTKLGVGIASVCALSIIPLGLSLTSEKKLDRYFHVVPDANLAQMKLAEPATLRACHDPDRSGWYGGWESESQTHLSHAPGRFEPDAWLHDHSQPKEAWLHLPKDHWIEVGFNGVIVDGEGDDIFIIERCCHGEQAEVLLVDKDGRLFPLAILRVQASGIHGQVTYAIDLQDITLPFQATAIRIKTINNGLSEYGGALLGLELRQVSARIKE